MQIVSLTMNPAIDRSTSVDHVAPEIKLRCDAPVRDPGGGGINVSRVIKRLGGTSTAVFPGGGETGALLQQLLRREEIDFQMIACQGLTRENLTVYDRSTTQQFRFGMPGAALSEAEWQACLDTLAGLTPGYLVVSGSLPPGVPEDFYRRVADLAQDMSAKLVLDTSGPALRAVVNWQNNGMVYLLKPNMRELSQFAGKELEDEDDQEAAVTALIDSGQCEIVVVSLGGGGALLATQAGIARFRAPSVPIRSKVGAGDSMVGAMVYHLALGDPVDQAVRYGVAAGSAAVATSGTDLCHKDDVERLYAQISPV